MTRSPLEAGSPPEVGDTSPDLGSPEIYTYLLDADRIYHGVAEVYKASWREWCKRLVVQFRLPVKIAFLNRRQFLAWIDESKELEKKISDLQGTLQNQGFVPYWRGGPDDALLLFCDSLDLRSFIPMKILASKYENAFTRDLERCSKGLASRADSYFLSLTNRILRCQHENAAFKYMMNMDRRGHSDIERVLFEISRYDCAFEDLACIRARLIRRLKPKLAEMLEPHLNYSKQEISFSNDEKFRSVLLSMGRMIASRFPPSNPDAIGHSPLRDLTGDLQKQGFYALSLIGALIKDTFARYTVRVGASTVKWDLKLTTNLHLSFQKDVFRLSYGETKGPRFFWEKRLWRILNTASHEDAVEYYLAATTTAKRPLDAKWCLPVPETAADWNRCLTPNESFGTEIGNLIDRLEFRTFFQNRITLSNSDGAVRVFSCGGDQFYGVLTGCQDEQGNSLVFSFTSGYLMSGAVENDEEFKVGDIKTLMWLQRYPCFDFMATNGFHSIKVVDGEFRFDTQHDRASDLLSP